VLVRACGLKKEHVLRLGKPLGSQEPSPNHHRHAQPCNQMLSLKVQQPGSKRTSSYDYSSTNLVSRYSASNLQPSLGAHRATSYWECKDAESAAHERRCRPPPSPRTGANQGLSPAKVLSQNIQRLPVLTSYFLQQDSPVTPVLCARFSH
jgi:hypothetical protein